MSLNGDNIADLEAARRKRPRWRDIAVKTSRGETIRFGLSWPDNIRLRDVPSNQIVNRLCEAGITHQGEPLPKQVLLNTPIHRLATLVAAIDRQLLRAQNNPAIMEMHERPLAGPLVSFEILLHDNRWHDVSLMPWGTSLRDADGDAVMLRDFLMRSGIALDGQRLMARQLAELDDCNVRRLADAIMQAAREWVESPDNP